MCWCSNGANSFGSSHSGEVDGFLTMEADLPGANAKLGDVDDEIATTMSSDAAVVVFVMV